MSLSEFIDKCLKVDSSKDMLRIVEKKVKKHFNLCNVNYTSSQDFQDLLKEKITLLEKKPDMLFIVIKDVVDELRLRKFKGSTEPPVKKLKVSVDSSHGENATGETNEPEPVEEKPKHEPRILKKLKKLLLILHRKIAKLETKEVNWDDDNDSTYIQLQRYRDRIVAVYQKINKYEGNSSNVNKADCRITFTGTPFPKVNRSIEKFVNKTCQFPDYRDILKILETTCEEEKISLNQAHMNNMAKSAFQEIGEQLQKKRQFEFWNSHSSYLGNEEDPAQGDSELEQKLEENRSKYGGKIIEVINKYVEEAEKQKLEPEEVPDDGDKSEVDDEKSEGDEDESEDCTEEDDNNYIDNVISDKKKATSSCEEISDNEDSDASGDVVCDDSMAECDMDADKESELSPIKEEMDHKGGENGKTEASSKDDLPQSSAIKSTGDRHSPPSEAEDTNDDVILLD